jgi:hypothetical protein
MRSGLLLDGSLRSARPGLILNSSSQLLFRPPRILHTPTVSRFAKSVSADELTAEPDLGTEGRLSRRCVAGSSYLAIEQSPQCRSYLEDVPPTRPQNDARIAPWDPQPRERLRPVATLPTGRSRLAVDWTKRRLTSSNPTHRPAGAGGSICCGSVSCPRSVLCAEAVSCCMFPTNKMKRFGLPALRPRNPCGIPGRIEQRPRSFTTQRHGCRTACKDDHTSVPPRGEKRVNRFLARCTEGVVEFDYESCSSFAA